MSWMSLFANLTFQQKNGGKSGWRELERVTERERERERERDLEWMWLRRVELFIASKASKAKSFFVDDGTLSVSRTPALFSFSTFQLDLPRLGFIPSANVIKSIMKICKDRPRGISVLLDSYCLRVCSSLNVSFLLLPEHEISHFWRVYEKIRTWKLLLNRKTLFYRPGSKWVKVRGTKTGLLTKITFWNKRQWLNKKSKQLRLMRNEKVKAFQVWEWEIFREKKGERERLRRDEKEKKTKKTIEDIHQSRQHSWQG